MYTQVEITREGESKVVWLPLPEGIVHVGDKAYAKQYTQHYQEWIITQVCITLAERDVPANATYACDFRLTPPKSSTIHMYI